MSFSIFSHSCKITTRATRAVLGGLLSGRVLFVTCGTVAVIQAHLYNLLWQSQECLNPRQSQRLLTAQGLEDVAVFVYH